MAYRVGVDIGGTFADFCALDEATGTVRTLKVLSTPAEPGREVMQGIAELQRRFGIARRISAISRTARRSASTP